MEKLDPKTDVIDPAVYEEFDRTKMDLMMEGGTFITSVGLMLKHIFTRSIRAARTDGLSIQFNPDFFMSMKPRERVFVLAHEIMHVALMHMIRLDGRDPALHNKAGDYVINDILHKAGYELLDDVLYDPKYHGMSTEEVYEHLKENGDPNSPNVLGIDLQQPSQEEGDGSEDNSTEDELEAKIQDIVIKAQTQAQLDGRAGEIPGEITRAIDALINPKLNWKQLLHRFMDSTSKDDYSWSKPNRRYMPEYYLPSQFSEGIDSITVAIDTSGSVSQEMLLEMMSEVKDIHDTYKPNKMVVIDCDHEIHGIHEINGDSDPTEIEFIGGGGTSFLPVLNYCKKNETNVLLYFTDLYAERINNEYAEQEGFNFETMWICYSTCEAPEYGETIYYTPDSQY